MKYILVAIIIIAILYGLIGIIDFIINLKEDSKK